MTPSQKTLKKSQKSLKKLSKNPEKQNKTLNNSQISKIYKKKPKSNFVIVDIAMKKIRRHAKRTYWVNCQILFLF
jgi:gentisate 1,2-dioxygenase